MVNVEVRLSGSDTKSIINNMYQTNQQYTEMDKELNDVGLAKVFNFTN